MLSFLNPFPSLPDHPGPCKVGTIEYEIPVSEISSESVVPDPTISTVKFRIFYPTTKEAKSASPVYWLPKPQDRWTEAYASFLGASPRMTTIISNLPSFLSYVKLPAVQNAPLLHRTNEETFPVAIFSHGLGGNYNTYSSITGGLASCGVVCVAPEHRDGSAPISFIKNSSGKVEKTVEYHKYSHSPTSEVLNARNAQLRIRSWELELIYSAVKAINEGKEFTNYAETFDVNHSRFSRRLNLNPGKVSWVGHSFGAATVTQFVKSVYYRKYLPTSPQQSSNGWDWTPLYKAVDDHPVSVQITKDSPIALLDLWTLPLRGEATKWLWDRPLPCYDHVGESQTKKTNTVAVMSAEFYKWADLLNRTRAALSKNPILAADRIENVKDENKSAIPTTETIPTPLIPEISKQDTVLEGFSEPSTRSASPLSSSNTPNDSSVKSSQSSLPITNTNDDNQTKIEADEPHLYLIPQSAHLSQSDFGPLFPNLTRYAMKAIEPKETIKLNLRAILAVIQSTGLSTKSLVQNDEILNGKGLGEKARWVRIPLVES